MKWKSSSSDFCFYVLILASAAVFVIGFFNMASLNYKQKHCIQDIKAEIIRIEKDTQTSGRITTTVCHILLTIQTVKILKVMRNILQ